jgi:low affinity Fe/Cu permease
MQRQFSRAAAAFARAAGHPLMFALSCSLIVVWAITGPAFAFSDTWQLVINTGTTIVTFLMVFLIQNTQNRDSAAIQAKLDELIRVSKAENTFIGIDLLTQAEVEELRERCAQRANGKRAARRVNEACP